MKYVKSQTVVSSVSERRSVWPIEVQHY